MQLEVILGTSIFSGAPCVGIALVGEANGINLCKAAEAASTWGRPAATQTLNGRTAAEQIAYLVGKWSDWATQNNIQIKITTTPRMVGAF